jgi:membrane protein implicated in regulation of membrane protease activity
MGEGRQQNRRVVGSGAIILLIIAVPLWSEFRVAGNAAWNIFLAVFLVGSAVAAIVLQRYFWKHSSEIGEARFDTTNSRDEP